MSDRPARTPPRGLALFMVVGGSVLALLGVVNLVINTAQIGSWLPPLVLMPVSIAQGVRWLRQSRTLSG